MTAEKAVSFIDTNVLVYAFDKSNSLKKQRAQRLIDGLMENGQLCLSTQVLQELFVTLTRKVLQPCSNEEAMAVLDDLAAWPVTVVDYPAIKEAAGLVGRAKLSFWDALVVVSAARASASILYTEDLSHGQRILGVQISNPFTM